MALAWVICHNARDRQALYTARAWRITGIYGEMQPTTTVHEGATLAEVREALPPGLMRFARDDDDDPVIVETWI